MSDFSTYHIPSLAIGVVGLAGRFPGATNVAGFWNNLRGGVESIKRFSDAELRAAGVAADLINDPEYVKAGTVLDDLEMFDASFFGLSPRDAAIMDPQHRHFLECAWEALEDAGHAPGTIKGSVGVYAGSGMSTYLIYNLLTNRQLVESAGLFLLKQTGNDKDVLATRVSYQLNLHGPSVNIQTACSTSLVAIHMACQSLLNHECDMALAGGVTIEFPHGIGYRYRDGEILSQDGHCRSFDSQSTGTVFGSGVGIVVLRRLEDAILDGDTIHAIVRGSAINNDGARKVGYLAPSVEGQAEVIAEALAVAGVKADSISYVETHGTGTKVGDPIEVSGLVQAFRESASDNGFCALGSVKSNIGHLDAAAGVAGFIKTVLALKHKQIPPSLHFQSSNPNIDFASSPFYVNTKLQDWKRGKTPRRAGVTSLGIGGTNAHVILEEAPAAAPREGHRSWQLLPISARSPQALHTARLNLSEHLRQNPDLEPGDVSFTTQLGRRAFRHRCSIVYRSVQEAAELLQGFDAAQSSDTKDVRERDVVFLFSGQGSQYVGMGQDIYREEPEFRRQVDTCAEALFPHLGLDLRTILYPAEGEIEQAGKRLQQTRLTQPALFVLEYALAKLWMSWGIRPCAMLGHSIGEYVAACLAEVFSLEDALAIVSARAELMQSLPAGAMVAVPLSEEEVGPLLSAEVALGAANGPRQCVVSGTNPAIEKFEAELLRADIPCHRLHTSHAFHSAMMDSVLDPFANLVRRFTLRPPRIPYISNLTGTWAGSAAADPESWAKHIRGTVRFADGLNELFRDPRRILLEIGPGQTLSALARQHTAKPKDQPVCHSMRLANERVSDMQTLLAAAGKLWSSGAAVNWESFRAHDRGRRTTLPTYPFERQRHWINPGDYAFGVEQGPAPEKTGRVELSEWFYRPTWKRAALRQPPAKQGPFSWLIFSDENLGHVIADHLRAGGHDVTTVAPGAELRMRGHNYVLPIGNANDYATVVADWMAHHKEPRKIVHLWSLNARPGIASLAAAQDACFYSLLYIAQALGREEATGIQLTAVSDRMQRIGDETVVNPGSAMLLGPCKVIPEEYAGIVCRSIDVSLAEGDMRKLAEQVIRESLFDSPDMVAACRENERWVENLEPLAIGADLSCLRLKSGGVYLITGGMGGIGLVVAGNLASEFRARLVLTGRSALPPREQWDQWLESGGDALIASRIANIRDFERAGAEVLAMQADVTNPEEMRRAVELARKRFGAINGVIHAAGVLNDGAIQLKTKGAADAVLAPKVRGTLVLDEALKGEKLDFLVTFSSISSVVPPAGQVDYAAANAFLDAFARARTREAGCPTVAINWSRWQDVGMGVQAGTRALPLPSASRHPLLEKVRFETSENIFSGQLNPDTHWILDEHRFKDGKALFPGVGYLEVVYGGMAQGRSNPAIEFNDVVFSAPFAFAPGQVREIQLRLRSEQGATRFSVCSPLAAPGESQEYASGTVKRADAAPPPATPIRSILERCQVREIDFRNRRTKQEKYFTFGPRWRSLQSIRLGRNEGISELEMPVEFSGDFENYRIHPALLDMASGSSLYLIRDYESSDTLYLPLSYKRMVVWRRLPARVYSHFRISGENTGRQEVVTFDVTVLDEKGNPLIAIEGFSLRRISSVGAVPIDDAAKTSTSAPAAVALGIPAAKGWEALRRILACPAIPSTVVVSPSRPAPAHTSGPAKPASESRAARSAEQPGTSAEPAKDDIETTLANWWRQLLGVETVRTGDDFFELGGHSLVAIRLFAKIRKIYGLDLALSTLFEVRTIEKLAELIRRHMSSETDVVGESPSLVIIQPQGRKPPLFFVSGVTGNVVHFQRLVKYLGPDQPVYALQPPGLDGKQEFLTRIEDLATHYLRHVKSVQPRGPYYLAGYSFGGFVAFEMVQQLHARGEEVGSVILLDTIERQYSERIHRSLTLMDRVKLDALRLAHFLKTPREIGNGIRNFGHNMFLRVYRVASRVVFLRSILIISPTLAASVAAEDVNLKAAAEYTPRVYPGRVTLIRCSERSILDGDDRLLGWGGLAAGGIDVREAPGDHLSIIHEPRVRVLAETLEECLRDARMGVNHQDVVLQ